MARFYVGQRVRIKWSDGWPELAGKEGTIIQKVDPGDALHPSCAWNVAPDIWGSFIAPYAAHSGGGKFGPSEDQLEPLTDCYDITTWDTCVWRPENMRTEA